MLRNAQNAKVRFGKPAIVHEWDEQSTLPSLVITIILWAAMLAGLGYIVLVVL